MMIVLVLDALARFTGLFLVMATTLVILSGLLPFGTPDTRKLSDLPPRRKTRKTRSTRIPDAVKYNPW